MSIFQLKIRNKNKNLIFGFADIWLEKVLEVLENPFCRLTTFLFLELLAYGNMRLIEGTNY